MENQKIVTNCQFSLGTYIKNYSFFSKFRYLETYWALMVRLIAIIYTFLSSDSAVVSRGTGGAMAPPLLERLTIRITKNCSLENASLCNGTTSFENLMMELHGFKIHEFWSKQI